MIVAFTGSQSGMTLFQRENLATKFLALGMTQLNHGDCIGSDLMANEIAIEMGCEVFYLFPSIFLAKRAFAFPDSKEKEVWLDWKNGIRYKFAVPGKPLERNQRLVDSASILLATPKEFKHTLRSGTWATIRYAWKKKKDVIIIPPVMSEEEEADNEYRRVGSDNQ